MNKLALLCLIATCITISTKAQQHRFGSWNELAFKHDLTKKLSVSADVMTRLYPPAYNSQYIAEAGISRELVKRLQLGAGYRLTLKDVGYEQRVQFDLGYTYRKKGFQLSNRVRYQYGWDYQMTTANYLRNKTTLRYRKLKKLIPIVAAEIFYHADYGFRYIDQLRFFAGADYQLNKQWEIGLQWIRTQEIQIANPLATDIIYVGVTYELPSGNKKKETEKKQSDP